MLAFRRLVVVAIGHDQFADALAAALQASKLLVLLGGFSRARMHPDACASACTGDKRWRTQHCVGAALVPSAEQRAACRVRAWVPPGLGFGP